MPASLRLQRRPRQLQRRLVSLFFWDLSIILAQISAAVVLACLFFSLPRLDLHLGKRIEALLPESVFHFFNSNAPIADPARLHTMESHLEHDFKATPANDSGGQKAFGLGSSKEEVLAAQGSPSSSSGNIWRYGASEVYFVSGRVAGWRNTPGDPLRLR
jgi:hypothetical protein